MPKNRRRPDAHSSGHLVAGNAQARMGPSARSRTTNVAQGAVRSFTVVRSSDIRANTQHTPADKRESISSCGEVHLTRFAGALQTKRRPRRHLTLMV